MINYQIRKHHDSPVLALSGTLDISSTSSLREELRRLIEEGNHRIIVDVNGLDYLDSSGLGVLVGAMSRLREKGGELPIIVSDSRIRRVFDITKLSTVFPMHASIDEISE